MPRNVHLKLEIINLDHFSILYHVFPICRITKSLTIFFSEGQDEQMKKWSIYLWLFPSF
jgi:hypothetical protein